MTVINHALITVTALPGGADDGGLPVGLTTTVSVIGGIIAGIVGLIAIIKAIVSFFSWIKKKFFKRGKY